MRGAAGAALASLPALAACVQDPRTLPQLALGPRPGSAHNRVLTRSFEFPILPGRGDELRALLKERRLFARPMPGVHFARAAQIGNERLTLGVIFDDRFESAVNFLVENGAALDHALRLCAGYPAGAALDPAAFSELLSSPAVSVPDKLFFTAYDHAESEVRACLAVYENFLALLRGASGVSDRQLPFLVDRFLMSELPPFAIDDAQRPRVRPGSLPFRPHLTNTLTMLQPLLEGALEPKRVVPCSRARLERIERFVGKHWTVREVFEFILTEGEFAVRDVGEHPLAALHTLHFARIAVVDTPRGTSMLFSSVYDGDFTQYVLDFGSRVADQIDFIWGLTQNYPVRGCRDVPAFIRWLRAGQVDVEDFFSAHGNVTLLQLQKAAALRDRLVEFSRALPPDGRGLRARLAAFARDQQALLS